MTEYEVESKVEYKYRRWNDNLNPVYKTVYHTEYVKKVLWIFNTYSEATSTSGYPGAKSGWSINKQWTTQEIDRYEGGYDYTGWQESAPFAWTGFPFYERGWELYTSQTLYRYRSRTLEWDSKASSRIEKVPLNYSLYNINGNPIEGGIKWIYSDVEEKMTTQKDRGLEVIFVDGIPNEKNLSIVKYYITSKEVMARIRDDVDKAYRKRYGDGPMDYIKEKVADKLLEVGLATLAKTILQKGLAGLTIGMLEYIDYSAYSGDQIAMFEYFGKINAAIESTDKEVVVMSFVHNTSAVVIPSRKLRLGFCQKTSVAMLYDYNFNYQHGLEYYIPEGAKAFGRVSYQSAKDMGDEIISILDAGYFSWATYFPWNLTT
jgi:hypothetical protein